MEKCCFSFFMVVKVLNSDQKSFGACGLWSACTPIFEGSFY